MNWYYADGGQQKGPVSEAELEAMHAAGTIKPDTLIWREGLANWQPYRQAKGGSAPPVAGGVVCTECKNIFPPDDVVRYGDVSVCANCKPVFVQRLKEGGLAPGAMEYASVGLRFGAKFLDNLIMWVVNTLFNMTVMAAAKMESAEENIAVQIGLIGVGTVFGLAYATFFLGRFGATPGKMACKIKVVNADGTPLTYGRAFGRCCAELVSGFTCGIGYLMAAFDDEKRTLHDRMASTRVVKR